jgi:hypothetical protein
MVSVARMLWSLVLALPLLAGADAPKILVRTEYCCSPMFAFSEVKEVAQGLLPKLSGAFATIRLKPAAVRGRDFVGGSSEKSPHTCMSSAVRIRKAISHAYLVKTPLGVSLHHWDAWHSRYESTTLAGRDILEERLGAGRIAWIGDFRLELPQVWLVSDAVLTEAQSSGFAGEAVRLLQLSDADVDIRTDPYLWRPDACPAYTVPMQWRTAGNGGGSDVSLVTTYCRIRAGLQQEACVVHRSQ